jgi:peptidoglycan/xylan/chitin deacetylase (PgdA/CDA1 family)
MLGAASRVVLVLVSVAAGSWVGLGRPDMRDPGTMQTLSAHALAAAPPWLFAKPATERGTPLPPDHVTASVDPAQLPDPTPFPRLNPDETTHRAWLLAEGPAPIPGDGRRYVTFTFDDGPFPETTPDILELLAHHHVKAAFFWIGRYLDGDGDRAVTTRAVARQVAAAGHFIGNHTRDHEPLTALTHAQVAAQIDDCSRSIQRVIGQRPTLFRPPYGALDSWGSSALRARGLELVLWSVEAEDMTHADATAMTDTLRSQIEYSGGGVVLLHDIRLTTIPVLANLLDWLDAHKWDPARPDKVGYVIEDLASYLRDTERSPQPYPDRPALERARAVASRKDHHRLHEPSRS